MLKDPTSDRSCLSDRDKGEKGRAEGSQVSVGPTLDSQPVRHTTDQALLLIHVRKDNLEVGLLELSAFCGVRTSKAPIPFLEDMCLRAPRCEYTVLAHRHPRW